MNSTRFHGFLLRLRDTCLPDVVLTGILTSAGQIIPESHCLVLLGESYDNWPLYSYVYLTNGSRMEATAEKFKVNLWLCFFIQAHRLDVNQADIVVGHA
jgi:hypothetical protein